MALRNRPTMVTEVLAVAARAGCSPREVFGKRDLESFQPLAMEIDNILARVGTENRAQKLEELEKAYQQQTR